MLEGRLQTLLEPVVEGLGYELVLLEFQGTGRAAILRLYIDSPGGIAVGDCERVSREVAATLDVEDPITTAYQLEVSSPGLDRPLVTPSHYQRFIGEQVKVQLIAPRDNRRKWLGVLVAASDAEIEIAAAEGRVTLSYAEIERARLVPDFDRELAKS
nr:ribosome maturation factor RimP [Flagellatimonas centrodinii]